MSAAETVVVTGAGRGLGLALTSRFLHAGRRVIATYRTPEGRAALNALDHADRLEAHTLDLTDESSMERFSASMASRTVDVLINNAGLYGRTTSRTRQDWADWRQVFEVNVFAPVRLTTTLLPSLRRAARPRVVTVSSQMGALQRRGGGAYSYRSSKAAVNKAMQAMAVDLESDGVVVCLVHPGWVRTDMGGAHADLSPEESARGIVALTDALTMVHSGHFYDWNGREHPW